MRKLVIGALVLTACGSPPRVEERIVTSIAGRVLDGSNQQPLGSALIQTEPFVKDVFTTDQGQYTIDSGLTVGTTYRVTATLDGYQTNSVTIPNIVEGTNTVADILLLPRGPTLTLSTMTVMVGAGSNAGQFRVENSGDTSQGLMFNISATDAWITGISPMSGTVTNIPETIRVDIDRNMLPMGNGDVTGNVEVATNGGSATVVVRVVR